MAAMESRRAPVHPVVAHFREILRETRGDLDVCLKSGDVENEWTVQYRTIYDDLSGERGVGQIGRAHV